MKMSLASVKVAFTIYVVMEGGNDPVVECPSGFLS